MQGPYPVIPQSAGVDWRGSNTAFMLTLTDYVLLTALKAGTIREILVSNAQPVEFDQPLMVIE